MGWMLAGAALGGAMGLLGSQGGSSGSQDTTQGYNNQGQATWAPQAQLNTAYANQLANVNALSGQPATYYPGQAYISPSAYTQQGVSQQGGIYNQALGNYNQLSNSTNVAANPYVQNQIAANNMAAMDTLTQQALPALQQGAIEVNNLGSSRLGLAQGTAVGETQKALAEQNANTQLNAYNSGLTAQSNALGQTGSMLTNALAQGQTVESYQQKALDDAMARWEWQYNEPWQRAQNTSSILGSLSNLGTTYQSGAGYGAGTQATTQASDPYSATLGGALAGGSLGYNWGRK